MRLGEDALYLSTPAHAAGTVEVIVTNPDGRAASGTFTYASPATFDFNGDWQGLAENLAVVCASRVDHSGQHCRQRLVRRLEPDA